MRREPARAGGSATFRPRGSAWPVSAHVEDEEENLFPALLEACPQDYLFELGDKIRQAKRTAPTRPRPSAPENKLATAGAGLVDRIRDVLTGRDRS